MGDIQRQTFSEIHKLKIHNLKGEFIGTLALTGGFSHKESWDHLKGNNRVAPEPSGPASRRIVSTLDSVNANLFFNEKTAKSDQEKLKKIAEEIEKNKGLLNQDGTVVSVESSDFKEKLAIYLRTKFELDMAP